MLGCRHVREHLSDSMDGELKGPYGFYVRLHAKVCPPCKRVRRDLEATVQALRALRDEPPGDLGELPMNPEDR